MRTAIPLAEALLRERSEAEWTQEVLATLRRGGWTAFHISRSMSFNKNGVAFGDKESRGWVDVWGWKIGKNHAHLGFFELKKADTPAAEAKQVEPHQAAILADLMKLASLSIGDQIVVLSGVLRPRAVWLLDRIAFKPSTVTQSQIPQS